MSSLKCPIDANSAMEVMKKFPDMAYMINQMSIFQAAVDILYEQVFIIKLDLAKRMTFSCKVCSKDMNSEQAVAQHSRSGAHQKNLDKLHREKDAPPPYSTRLLKYDPDSLQYRLGRSKVNPLGLQMVEEYTRPKSNSPTSSYFKCNLCGAHGKIDTMYHHIIGKKHSEKYIRNAVVLQNSILTSNEREELRETLVQISGVNLAQIHVIRGNQYFPKKWAAEGRAASALAKASRHVKEESMSRSPSPSPRLTHLKSVKMSPKESPKRCIDAPKPNRQLEAEVVVQSPSLSSSFQSREPSNVPKIPIVKAVPSSSTLAPEGIYRNPSPPPAIEMQNKLLLKGKKSSVGVQKCDLEETMLHLLFIDKTKDMPDSDLKTPEDVKLAIKLMFDISRPLHTMAKGFHYLSKSKAMKQKAESQIELLEKIMGTLMYTLRVHWASKYGSFDRKELEGN